MEHTNKIIRDILCDAYPDYRNNEWHYDKEYKLCEKAINAALKLNGEIRESEKEFCECPTLRIIRTRNGRTYCAICNGLIQ